MSLGYTLLELVLVLAMAATLAAFAWPRHAQLKREARVGSLLGARGAVAAAATLAHAAVQVRQGRPDSTPCKGGGTADNRSTLDGSVCSDAGLIATRYGYPAATGPGTPGITTAAGLAGAGSANDKLREAGYSVWAVGDTLSIARSDAPEPGQCSFTYTAARTAGAAPTISEAVITGC